MPHFVFIMASRPNGALFTGRARDLRACVEAHREGRSNHAALYKIDRLVWFECHDAFETALKRERSIKRWKRAWKIDLIMNANPNWHDITAHIPT